MRPRSSIFWFDIGALVVGALLACGLFAGPASAQGCSGSAHAGQSGLTVAMTCGHRAHRHRTPHHLRLATASGGSSPVGPSTYIAVPVCVRFPHAHPCGGQSRCVLHATVMSNLHGVRPGAACASAPTTAVAAAAVAPPPQVTPGMVLTAMRSVGLPALRALTQPRDKTLVNFPTIFYTHPRPFSRTVTLLGQPVAIAATPVGYTWHYGDGTGAATAGPGAPYPSTDITHEYVDAHVTVRPSVDVAYGGRFRVGGGAWRPIPGTVTIPGPTAPLRIAEAVPVLSGDYS